MNCYQAKTGELLPQWYVIDATNVVVGRLAAQIAPILMGKHRPTYTPHVDTGDFVIVTNVDKVVFTGNKWQQKSYQRYSGWPSGQREEVAWKLFKRRPERILELAVRRMMPKNKIGRHMLLKLKLYVGDKHPHQAQMPVALTPLDGKPAVAGAIWMPKPVKKAKVPRSRKDPLAKELEAQDAAAAQLGTSELSAASAPSHEPKTPELHAAAAPTHESATSEAHASARVPEPTPAPAEPATTHEPAAEPAADRPETPEA